MPTREQYAACNSWADLQAIAPGSIGGWMCEPEREYLFQLAKQMQPGQRFMEIGVYGGTTLSIFALMAPDCEVWGMDSWENDTPNLSQRTGVPVDLRTFCVENLEANGVADRVTLFDGSSHGWGKSWASTLDVLIVDGDHTRDGALADLRDFSPWVRPGGLLIMDDYWGDPQVRDATDQWLGAEPAGWWTRIWGGEKEERNETSGLVSKMLVFRRAGG